ncbi:hypothetical protein A2755_01625 [Candidatus Wolfebacteria bacterium RIFCSPHIGHO2_01_FULL_48_22]|uniref:Major facilitator superfamily (MFS) profile domain-containing protein n=2 Tax=Candidatus Wolfeibacteriota TaxID=1752735 RepID=A0A1F8DR36_9BACT|nr:MAG: hypothetical protein A2755_01625 [Candidatus Wolfebacteria bacterium RIFCSPHIGHO2_01_FULL_48_22]OGM91937.1 MAG: hypothetical protein A2935_02265 [Candidatus Wolfebacteria bacterium RIFCSPLOWO2_01_FULL_47_17b]
MHNTKHILKIAAANALITAVYIVLVSLFLMHTEQLFNTYHQETILMPILMLLLFVFSAGLSGLLIFGKPVMWYLDGKKKEAVSLLTLTLLFLIILTFIAFLLSFLIPILIL